MEKKFSEKEKKKHYINKKNANKKYYFSICLF